MKVTVGALNRATLARQHLLERTSDGLAAVASRLGGLQAQWAKPPFVGFASRVEGFVAKDLTRALHAKKLVRATLWRGTIHTCTTRDFLAQRKLVVATLQKASESILKNRSAGLDVEATVKEAKKLLAREPMTFGELREKLVAKFPKAEDRALGFAVRMHVPLVMVPTDDPFAYPQDAKFALADDFLGKKVDTSAVSEKDLEALVETYLGAFGPATVVDAQIWSGVPGLAKTFAAMRDRLVAFEVGKQKLFDLPDAPRPHEDTPAPLRVIAEYDNILLAHKDRSRWFDAAHKNAVYVGGLRVAGTILIDGRVGSTWRVDREKKIGVLTASPFSTLPRKVLENLEKEALPIAKMLLPECTDHEVRIAGKKSPAGS